MKQTGIFNIIQGKPIVFAYELQKPDQNGVGKYLEYSKRYFSNLKEYESSRREWSVEGVSKFKDYHWIILPDRSSTAILKGQQIKFVETQPAKAGERGKCKITKIIDYENN